MGMFVWVMVGLAIWHFSIFVPDRFAGGIVGAFVAAIIGSVAAGLILSGASVPGRDDTDVVTGLLAVPGSVAGMAVAYLLGVRAGNEPVHI